MERKRTIEPRLLTEEQKWLATAENIGRNIPYLRYLTEEFNEFWCEDDFDITPIRMEIRQRMREWMKFTPEADIIETISYLDPAARNHLLEIMPLQYRGFFEYQGGQFPIELCCPIPFLPIEKKYGVNYQITKPIKKQFGKNTLEISGTLCNPEAGKTWVALNQIRKRKVGQLYDGTILSFRTSFTEICRELGKNKPGASNVQEGIIHNLEQLRGISITWRNGRQFYVGGLIHLATNLRIEDCRDVQIYQDRFFIDQILNQFIGIKDVGVYYSLRGKGANLYLFLNNFESFRKYDTFNSKKWHWKYNDVYDMAGLKSPLSKPTEKFMLDDLTQHLEEFRRRHIIKNHSYTDEGHLLINHSKSS
jgi:hypothetical protein